jgi:hypothetical protein
MNEKQYTQLSTEQREQIRVHLLGKPSNLGQGFSPAEFSRQFDVYVYFVEQKIGAQFDQVHEDALSRSPTPFANTRTSPSHQPARDHTASQEQVRQYTLTR